MVHDGWYVVWQSNVKKEILSGIFQNLGISAKGALLSLNVAGYDPWNH
jgi:hypothetical protein